MTVNTTDPLIGRTLNDFVVDTKLGEGGFGAVYKAKQLILGREAVIKVLHAKHRTNPEIIKRFKREAHLASRLEHPYCAHIYSFGAEDDGLLWIAMEFVQGTTLSEILKSQKTVLIERFIPLLDKICEVVHTAHEAGIIHRDLKPANIMVISRAGRMLPKLLDFGIAKGLEESSVLDNKTSDLSAIEDKSNRQNAIISFSLNKEETIVVENQSGTETIISDIQDIFESKTVIAKVQNIYFNAQNVLQLESISDSQSQTIIVDVKATAISEDQDSGYKTQGLIGSPAYMSPEQWQTATIDGCSDIYSLGVLTYQAITGELPFKEEGFELCAAHINKPIPKLREGFPTALNDVMKKVMAKNPKDRYQTALEFAKGFREAAGFIEQRTNLFQLDEILKENLLANAPKPIADTVANLLAAHNAYQFKDRALLVFRVLVRYLGVLTLASYVQVLDNQQDNELIKKAVTSLYQQGLNETQWIELCKELCRPFAKKCGAFPIPEVVSLFFAPDGEELNLSSETFTKLLQLQQEIYSSVSLKEEELLKLLTDFLAKLSILLKITSWLNDYYLVLPEGKQASKWMGVAKDISTIRIKVDKFFDKKTALVDADGYFVLSLWPLIEIIEPTPGAPLEVFLLECRGRNKEKTKLVSFPHGFQIETQAPWQWIKDNFLTDEEKKQTDLLPEISPYLGLTTFSPTDSAFFFGREKETESFLNRLRIKPLLAVVGPSGAGKSSFIQAGIIPNLDEQWRVITVRPGSFPLANLSARLIKEGVQVPKLDINSKAKIDVLGNALSNFSKAKNISTLLVIDQFEELFTLCLDQQERELYAKYLVNAANSEEESIRIIITLRDDFLIRVKSLPSLRDQIAQNLELLATPQPEDLLRILTEPAKRFGYQFEDEELPKEIVESVKKEVSALPLLAFTAAKLWELRDRQLKKLQRKTYVEMGGIGGSLTQHAETVMAEMSQDEQKLLREAFRHLVTSEGTRAVLTRSDLKQLLGNNREADLVIEKLVTARLLVASEGEGGIEETIEVIHEALLSAWPRLVKWRQETAEGARLRDQLRVAAKQWQERGHPRGLLWRDEALAEYQLWKLHYKGNLTEVEKEFGLASLSEANRNQRIKRTLLVIAMIVLLVGSGVMFYQRQQTQKQLSQTLELYEEQARQEIIKNNLDGAAVYLSEAYAKGANSLALKYMLSIALAKAENRPPISLNSHEGTIMMAAFSQDDQTVVTASADKTARIWQASDGKQLFVLNGHEDTVLSAKFSPDGTQVLTSSLDKTARIWRVYDGSLRATLSGHTEGLRTAIFSPDGKQILTASYDHTAKIWDASTGKLINTLAGHENGIYAVCYSKDSKLIATASADKTTKIWDSSNGKLLTTLIGHQATVMSVAFSPDAELLVTGSNDSRAKVWQIDGTLLHTLAKHKEAITSSTFSSDGKSILTTSKDKTACIWDRETGSLVNTLTGHKEDITAGDFSPNDKLIITSAYDNTARVWERATGKFLVTLAAHEKSLTSGVFSSSGEKVLTASLDKTIKIWNVVAETRLPSEISIIVKEKVPIYLKEGRLIAKDQTTNIEQAKIEKLEISTENKIDKNTVIETLDNSIKIEMVKIEGGTFEMGSPIDEKGRGGNEELHTVTVSSFYIGKYEVTQAQWKEIASQPIIKTSLLAHPSAFQADNLPVDNVSWEEAIEFCARLSKLTGKNYRLPTEAEWEYASRAGSKEAYTGNLEDMGWYDKNSKEKTHVVGQKLPNSWGLYDMHGNLWEWCIDGYGDYPTGAAIDPIGVGSGTGRVRRGGSWFSSAADCRSAKRNTSQPDYHGNILGFRLAQSIK